MAHAGEQGPSNGLSDDGAMLDAVTDRGAIKLDATGKVVGWSAGARALLGYSETEVLGQPVSMFNAGDDRAAGWAECERAATQESDRGEFEGWRVRKGGHRFRAGVVVSAIRDQAGSLSGFIIVMRDLAADQQRDHTMFYDLLEAAPDAMVIVGPDGRITLANAQTDRLFGYPRQELVGSEVEVLLPPRFRGKHIGYRTDFTAHPRLRQMGRVWICGDCAAMGQSFPSTSV